MNYAYGSYSQPRLVELHMTCEHVACLDWFVSFMGTSKVRTVLVDQRHWVQVSFKAVVDDLPILGLGERQVRRKFDDLAESGVLSKRVDGKQATYFRINDSVYLSLFQSSMTPVTNVCHGSQTNDTHVIPNGGSYDAGDNRMTPVTNVCHGSQTEPHVSATENEKMLKNAGETLFPDDSPEERIIQSPSRKLYPHSSNEELPPEGAASKSRRFVKPTVEDVMAYCQERHNGIDAKSFVDFYESKGWLVGKTPMKDWRAAVRTWERRDNHSASGPVRKDDERTLGSANVWDDYTRLRGGAV